MPADVCLANLNRRDAPANKKKTVNPPEQGRPDHSADARLLQQAGTQATTRLAALFQLLQRRRRQPASRSSSCRIILPLAQENIAHTNFLLTIFF